MEDSTGGGVTSRKASKSDGMMQHKYVIDKVNATYWVSVHLRVIKLKIKCLYLVSRNCIFPSLSGHAYCRMRFVSSIN